MSNGGRGRERWREIVRGKVRGSERGSSIGVREGEGGKEEIAGVEEEE